MCRTRFCSASRRRRQKETRIESFFSFQESQKRPVETVVDRNEQRIVLFPACNSMHIARLGVDR